MKSIVVGLVGVILVFGVDGMTTGTGFTVGRLGVTSQGIVGATFGGATGVCGTGITFVGGVITFSG